MSFKNIKEFFPENSLKFHEQNFSPEFPTFSQILLNEYESLIKLFKIKEKFLFYEKRSDIIRDVCNFKHTEYKFMKRVENSPVYD